MKTVRVQCSGEGQVFPMGKAPPVKFEHNSVTELSIETWLELNHKFRNSKLLNSKIIHVIDETEESEAEAEYKAACFSEFSVLGLPAVKAALDGGIITPSVKSLLASEWVIANSENWKESFLAEARRANRLAEEANSLAEEANSRATRANCIALIAAAIATPGAIMAISALIKIIK